MRLNPFAMMKKMADDKGIVFDPENNKVLTLNATGVVVWEAIAAGLDEARTLRRLVEEFEVPQEVAERDLRFFLDVLKAKGLLSED